MDAMQCLGGNGYINGKRHGGLQRSHSPKAHSYTFILDYPMGRILRDSRLYTVGAGTQEIRRMLIGREFNEQLKDRS